MQEDERDLLEIRIFDEIEKTVGTWLRGSVWKKSRRIVEGSTKAADPKPGNVERNAPSTRLSEVYKSWRLQLRWTGGRLACSAEGKQDIVHCKSTATST